MTENKCSKNDRRTKRQKTAVSVLIAIILLAAVAVLVACIGVNFMGNFHIKTANFLPALLVPPMWTFLQTLIR